MLMSDFEIRANNYVTAIGAAKWRVEDFGYDRDPAEEVTSRVYSSFVTWLTACEEARAQHRLSIDSASFKRHVIDQLPDVDDPSWDVYIRPVPISTLKQRACALWGIRVASCHGDGDTNLVASKVNRAFALSAPAHLSGVELRGSKLYVSGAVTHEAIRTIVQIQDVLV